MPGGAWGFFFASAGLTTAISGKTGILAWYSSVEALGQKTSGAAGRSFVTLGLVG